MKKVLVTGAAGQIGSELTGFLRNIYGSDPVIAAGHVKKPSRKESQAGMGCEREWPLQYFRSSKAM